MHDDAFVLHVDCVYTRMYNSKIVYTHVCTVLLQRLFLQCPQDGSYVCVYTRMYTSNCCCRGRGSSSNALKMGHTYAYATHRMLLIRMHITGRPVAEALPPMPSKWVADELIRNDWVPSALRKKKKLTEALLNASTNELQHAMTLVCEALSYQCMRP
jgi:hypothetical protein